MAFVSSSGVTNSVKATVSADINFTQSQTTTTSVSRNESEKMGYSFSYTYGSGTGVVATDPFSADTINAGVKLFGQIPASGSDIIDISQVNKEVFNGVYTIQFDILKGLIVRNTMTTVDADIALQTTGVGGLSGLFNGGSGNILVKPKSAYIFNDPFGTACQLNTSTHKDISLHDVNGSGCTYQVILVGTSGVSAP